MILLPIILFIINIILIIITIIVIIMMIIGDPDHAPGPQPLHERHRRHRRRGPHLLPKQERHNTRNVA